MISIRAARVNKELTQKEAARKIGISEKTLRNWERGKAMPRADKFSVLCQIYGISFSDSILQLGVKNNV